MGQVYQTAVFSLIYYMYLNTHLANGPVEIELTLRCPFYLGRAVRSRHLIRGLQAEHDGTRALVLTPTLTGWDTGLKGRPSDLAHHTSHKGEVRRLKYSAHHAVRPKKILFVPDF